MKKIIYLAVSALLSFSSCSDFLDKKPLDSLTEDAVFNDDALLTAYVTACYYNSYPNGFDEAMSSSATDESYTRHGDGSSNIVARGEMNPDNVETLIPVDLLTLITGILLMNICAISILFLLNMKKLRLQKN